MELYLNSVKEGYRFEILSAGSSFGQYSLLKSQDLRPEVGTSHFYVKAVKWSQIIYINHTLLSSVRAKFRKLDRAIDDDSKHILLNGIPYCDFSVNYAALKR